MLPFQGAGDWFYPLPKATSFQDSTLGSDMIGFQPEEFKMKTVKSIIRFLLPNVSILIFELKARNIPAQWQRPEGATPWVNKNVYNKAP